MRIYDRAREVINRLLLSEGLRAKTMRGGAWLGAGSVAEQAVRFGRNMLLARLLAPEAFGTMAIVLSSASLVDTLTEVGHQAAIIQNPRGAEKSYLNAAWWMGLGRALFSYSIVFAIAPWISQFYGRPELSALLRVALLAILLNAAMSPHAILAQKKMDFGRWAVIANGGGICGVILTIILSFLLRDVWALAIGYCGEQAFRTVLSYILCPALPSLKWDLHAGRDLLTFSRGMFGLSFLNFLVARIDIFVLARLYSSTDLGLYTMSVSLVSTPMVFLTNLLGQALIPALSTVQKDLERVNRVLVEVTSWLMVLGLPATVFIWLSAPYLLEMAYGSRYIGAAGPLSVASVVVLITVLNAVVTCVLFAKGRPGLHREAVAATAITVLIAIYPATKILGPVGGQVTALFGIAVGSVLQLTRLRSVTGLTLLVYARSLAVPTFASAGTLAITLFGRSLGLVTKPATFLTLCAGTCLIACALGAADHMRTKARQQEPLPAEPPESLVSL